MQCYPGSTIISKLSFHCITRLVLTDLCNVLDVLLLRQNVH